MVFDYNSLVEVLAYRAEKSPETIAYTFLKKGLIAEEITYGKLDNQAKSIAAAIQKGGLEKADRVLLIFPPGLELIQAYFGCLYAGAIAIPVYPPINAKLEEKTQRI